MRSERRHKPAAKVLAIVFFCCVFCVALVLRMDGPIATEVGNSPNGGNCGDCVDGDGAQLVAVKQVFQSGTLDTTAIP